MNRSPVANGLTIALIALLGVLLIAPIFSVTRAGFVLDGEYTTELLTEVLNDVGYMTGLKNSFYLAFFTTVLCLAISLPLALIAERFDFRAKKWMLALIQVPLILPPFVGAIGMKGLLSRNGGINALLAWMGIIDPTQPIDWLADQLWSTIVLETLYLYPIMFLNVQAALAGIDPALDEAGRNLGAGAWRRFWKITFPLLRPGVFAGSTIVFIWAFTELGTPLMVGLRDVTAVQVYDMLETTDPDPTAYSLVFLLMAASVLMYIIGKLVLGRTSGGMMAKATVASPPTRLRGWRSLAALTPFAVVFLVAALPHIGVILGSITDTGMIEIAPDKLTPKYHVELAQQMVSFERSSTDIAAQSIYNSFKYSIIATTVDLGLGFAIAYLLVRKRSMLTGLLDAMAMLPLAVPGLVMATGYFAITQGDSILSFLDPIRHDPTPLLVIAYSVRRLPFIVRSCAAGLEQMSDALEEAAINMGASTPHMLRRVTIPLLMPNLIAGSLLVFSRSMLEVSDSLILAFDTETYPLTKAIFSLQSIPQSGMEMASALGAWGMVLLTVTIAGASLALGKRLGALFRV